MPGEGLAPDAAVPGVGDGTGLSPVVGGASVWPKFGSPGGDSSTPCTLFDGLDLVTGLLAPGLAPGVAGAGVLAAGLVGAAGKPVVAAGSGVIVVAGGSGASVAACEVGAGVPGAAEAALLSWGGRGAAVVAWGKAADPTVMAGAAAMDMRELSFSPKWSMRSTKSFAWHWCWGGQLGHSSAPERCSAARLSLTRGCASSCAGWSEEAAGVQRGAAASRPTATTVWAKEATAGAGVCEGGRAGRTDRVGDLPYLCKEAVRVRQDTSCTAVALSRPPAGCLTWDTGMMNICRMTDCCSGSAEQRAHDEP